MSFICLCSHILQLPSFTSSPTHSHCLCAYHVPPFPMVTSFDPCIFLVFWYIQSSPSMSCLSPIFSSFWPWTSFPQFLRSCSANTKKGHVMNCAAFEAPASLAMSAETQVSSNLTNPLFSNMEQQGNFWQSLLLRGSSCSHWWSWIQDLFPFQLYRDKQRFHYLAIKAKIVFFLIVVGEDFAAKPKTTSSLPLPLSHKNKRER